ncbi:MAG: SdrD B-like domain-containing protein [Candidatus Kerfeldbacteria bacterium]
MKTVRTTARRVRSNRRPTGLVAITRFVAVSICLLALISAGFIWTALRPSAASASIPTTGTISGVVWHDLNGNKLRDAGEPGMPNVMILTTRGNKTITAADGSYTLTNVLTGRVFVIEATPAGYVNTNANNVIITNAVAGQTTANINFGNYQTLNTHFTGGVYNDANGNGHRDTPGDKWVKTGLTVTLWQFDIWYFNHPELYGANDGYLEYATTTTNSGGQYDFSTIDPGKYKLTVTPDAGYAMTEPASGQYIDVLPRSGGSVGPLDFGVHSSTVMQLLDR